jgi:hypothetical protein
MAFHKRKPVPDQPLQDACQAGEDQRAAQNPGDLFRRQPEGGSHGDRDNDRIGENKQQPLHG